MNSEPARGRSQSEHILRHMLKGRSIDPQVALRLFGSMRLAARIQELEELGWTFRVVRVTNRQGRRFARYHLTN